ncbi:MAG: hypothetical protein LAP13_27280 [Acidobacteriia bacterium]|nr:hypothetical protein [Terriglobia bacterium]
MTLMDAPPPKPPRHVWKYILLVIILAAIGVGIYAYFRDYSEEQAVEHFLTTLQQGKYEEAYKMWQPSPSYSYQDFLHDWGAQGDYGKIREFQILGSRSKGSQTVIITVRINNVDPPIDLLVDRKTKGLAYSIF